MYWCVYVTDLSFKAAPGKRNSLQSVTERYKTLCSTIELADQVALKIPMTVQTCQGLSSSDITSTWSLSTVGCKTSEARLSYQVLVTSHSSYPRRRDHLVLSRCSPNSKESNRWASLSPWSISATLGFNMSSRVLLSARSLDLTAQWNHRSVLSFLQRGLEANLHNSKFHSVRLDRCLEVDFRCAIREKVNATAASQIFV
jgi:hypothetical protein